MVKLLPRVTPMYIDLSAGNLSTMNTLRPEKQFVIQRFPLFRGYLIYLSMYLDPRKQFVIERFRY